MSWRISTKQYIPAVIGEPFGGGYFAGYISHTANGQPTHALIVAPAATGQSPTTLQFRSSDAVVSGTTSLFDGYANTQAIIAAGIADFPGAQFCVNLTIGGFTDWYLPSVLEHDIAYQNLKPRPVLNNPNDTAFGINAYAVPKRDANRTPGYPEQTNVTLFQFGQTEALGVLMSSTTSSNLQVPFIHSFTSGSTTGSYVTTQMINLRTARAFRRIAL